MANKILAGRYELLEKKGDGGMAVVYKAKDRLLNRFVAIKILRPEFIRDPKFIDSFRRESQSAAGLSHPNIVSVYDVGKEGNIYYIVMELLDGDNLSDLIARKAPLDEKQTIDIARKIALALSFAHKKKIIHRDVKPHNILITDDGTVKIADFGIARAVNSGTIVNNTSTVMGSVHYLSPEQAKGGYVDSRSDIYSLGIVMYDMLTGTVPFDGENAVSVAMMHMNEDVPAPSLVNPHVSPMMDAIVLKAAARRPEDRFSSADELIEALNSLENGQGMTPADIYNTGYYDGGYNQVKNFEDLENDFRVSETRELPSASRASSAKGGKSALSSETKKMKRIKLLAIVVALICAVPLSLIILNACNNMNSATIPVPNVIGMTQAEAVKALNDAKLDYKIGTPVVTDKYESGQVVSTNPDVGTKVKKGYKVEIIISKGSDSEKVKVPPVIGLKIKDAEETLENFDLKYRVVYEDSDKEPDTVIVQDPEARTEVDIDSTITLTVSKELKDVDVPNLIGMTQKEAKKALEDAGLKLGDVAEKESNKDEGTVIEQSKAKNSSAKAGDSVNIVISSGPGRLEAMTIPLGIDYSSAANEVFALTVTVTDANGLQYVVNNQQRIRSDGGETVEITGIGRGMVRVIFDDTIVKEYNVDFDTGTIS